MSEIRLPARLSEFNPDNFFLPGLDENFFLIPDQGKEMGRIMAPEVGFLPLSTLADHRLKTYGTFWRREKWTQNVLLPSLLAVAQNVTFTGEYVAIDGKYLLNGAAGVRLREDYAQSGPVIDDVYADELLTERLHHAALQVSNWPIDYEGEYRGLDFFLPFEKAHGYARFMAEALPCLTLYRRFGLTGRILVCGGDIAEGRAARDAIQTWFPDLLEHVVHLPQDGKPLQLDRVIIPFVPLHLYFQCQEQVIPTIIDVGVPLRRTPSRMNVRALQANSCDTALIDLHNSIQQSVGAPPRTRRLYIKRKSGRHRNVVNEQCFVEKIRAIGFEVVSFDDYSVFEQARMMAQAQIVIGMHGDWLVNMVYAQPGCDVVDLTNLQIIRSQFGNFNSLAAASGVRQHHLVLDHDFVDSFAAERIPRMSLDGMRGVVFTPFTASAAFSYVHALLYPNEAAALFARCEALHMGRDKVALDDFLDQHGDQIAHLADTHVWHANSAAHKGDRPAVLQHLLHAMALAPKRPMLIRRILDVAYELQDGQAFHEALLHLQRYYPAQIEPLFQQKGWSLLDLHDDYVGQEIFNHRQA